MKSINQKINELNRKEKKAFLTNLEAVLYCRGWCKLHGIDYANPDIKKTKEELYNSMFSEL